MLISFFKTLLCSQIKHNLIEFRRKVRLLEPEKYDNHHISHESKLTVSENLENLEIAEKSIQISNLRFEEYSPGEIFKNLEHLEFERQNKTFIP